MTPERSKTLFLKEAPESAPVKEAKEAAKAVGGDPALTNWALGLIEDRDRWRNRRPQHGR